MQRKTLLTLILLASTAVAADLPSGESLMDRFVELTGGAASYKALKSQSIKSEIEFVGQGLKGTTTTLSVYPDRTNTTMELTGLGKIFSGGWDGVVWESSAMQGQRLVKGTERSMMLRLNDIRAAADWRKYYESATTEAEETVEGQACYRVVSKPKDAGNPETTWFSKATGLAVKTEFTLVSAMGQLPISILVSDYRKVGAFLLPHRSIQSMGPQKMDSKIIELLVNPDIEEAKLAPPADIKALIAKEQKTN